MMSSFGLRGLVLSAVLGVATSACGGGDENGSEPSTVLIPESTKVVDSKTLEALESVSPDRVSYTFSHATPFLDALTTGDVMVADVHPPILPFGMLRRVEAVQRSGSVVVTTTQAALTDAVERGAIHEQFQLDKSGTHPLGVGPEGLVVAFNDVVIFDGDEDSSTDWDQVVLDGNIGFEPNLVLDIDIDNFELQSMKFGVSTDLTASVTITASREASFTEKMKVGQVNLPTITFTIGPVPVVIVPKLVFWAGVDGTVSAVMEAGAELDAHAEAGFGYDGNDWAPYADITGSGSLQTPKLKDGIKASARVWAGPRLDVLLYDVAGVNAALYGYARASIDSEANPWWQLAGGLDAELGAGIWFLGATIADYSTPILNKEFPLGAADGPSPSAKTPGIDTWARSFGGGNDDYPVSVLSTQDGGLLMVGTTNSFTDSPNDAWVVKLDKLGGVSWQIGVEDLGNATNAVETENGYVVSTGSSAIVTDDVVLLWLDHNGALVAARSYDAPGGLAPDAMQAAPGGDVVLAGGRDGETDGWAARIGPDGAVRWSKTYGGAGTDVLSAVALAPNAGFTVAGSTTSHGASFNASWVMNLNGDGGIVWQEMLDGSSNEWLRGMVSDATGNLTLVCDDHDDAIVARLSPAGAISWARAFDAGTEYEGASGILAVPDGSFVVTGKTDLYHPYLWAFKLGSSGDMIWNRSYGGPVGDKAGGNYDSVGRPVAFSSQAGFLIAGSTESFGAGGTDAWLLHVPENGFVAFDAASGATGAALTGTVSDYALTATSIAVTTADLPLSVADVSGTLVLISTQASVKTQAEVP